MYVCECCDYSTDKQYNLDRHNATDRHLKRLKDAKKKKTIKNKKKSVQPMQSIQPFNTMGSSTSDDFDTETTIQEPSVVTPTMLIKMFESMNVMSHNMANLIALAQTNADALKSSTIANEKTAEVASKSMTMLKYANTHLKDAPPLKALDRNEACGMLGYDNPENLEEENEKYVKLVLANYENKNIPKFFGDLIVNYYKEEDVRDVRFWSADVARLCFIVMQTVNKKGEKEWSNDKSGTKFTAMVISPMFEALKEILKTFLNFKSEWAQNNPNPTTDEMWTVMNLRQGCANLLKDLKYDKFTVPILKIVAPSFNFDTYKVPIDVSDSKTLVNTPNQTIHQTPLQKNMLSAIVEDENVFSSTSSGDESVEPPKKKQKEKTKKKIKQKVLSDKSSGSVDTNDDTIKIKTKKIKKSVRSKK